MLREGEIVNIGFGSAEVTLTQDKHGNIYLGQRGPAGKQWIMVENADADDFRKAIKRTK